MHWVACTCTTHCYGISHVLGSPLPALMSDISGDPVSHAVSQPEKNTACGPDVVWLAFRNCVMATRYNADFTNIRAIRRNPAQQSKV